MLELKPKDVITTISNLKTGEVYKPQSNAGESIKYFKNRISVPRDMPVISARILRQSLNKIDSLSEKKDIEKIPVRHRYDQDPRNFQ